MIKKWIFKKDERDVVKNEDTVGLAHGSEVENEDTLGLACGGGEIEYKDTVGLSTGDR